MKPVNKKFKKILTTKTRKRKEKMLWSPEPLSRIPLTTSLF